MLTAQQIRNILNPALASLDGMLATHEKHGEDYVGHHQSVREVKETLESLPEKIEELTKADATMLTAAAALENEVTSTLLDMAVATVLATLLEEEGGGRCNVAISPNSMSYMTKNYTYSVTMNGMTRNIAIQMREDSPLRHNEDAWNAPSNRHGVALDPDMTGAGAKPQAEPKEHDRPVWAVKTMGHDFVNDIMVPVLRNCHDRQDAERQCLDMLKREPNRPATVENRYCLHPECPSTGCNQAEATSDDLAG